jgi:hypothetical protein
MAYPILHHVMVRGTCVIPAFIFTVYTTSGHRTPHADITVVGLHTKVRTWVRLPGMWTYDLQYIPADILHKLVARGAAPLRVGKILLTMLIAH